MAKAIIRILDSVHCKANKEAREKILACLAYKEVQGKRGRYGQREEYVVKQHLITGRIGTGGTLLTGLLPRVKAYCKSKGKKIVIRGKENLEKFPPDFPPALEGIDFRPDQVKALEAVKKHNRGKIVFPTGSGKTLIALGIYSMFKDARCLFLCHTTDLASQAKEEAERFFSNVVAIGGKYKRPPWKAIANKKSIFLISTIQSFVKYDPNDYSTYFDIVIVDEVHHVNSLQSQYGKVLQLLLAPRKYGLTGTEPSSEREFLVNEGLFGEKIASLEYEEGQAAGIIADVNINLIAVPFDKNIKVRCSTYKDYYKYAIVQNRRRNLLLAHAIDKREITLVIVERVEHGRRIAKTIERRTGLKCPFVHGDTKGDNRDVVKRKLIKGKLKVAVASRVWKEGINIPALDHIINAVGMKEEKAVLQTLGRGLRTTDSKKSVRLTDFLDPYRYLAEHSILRLQVYSTKGWL